MRRVYTRVETVAADRGHGIALDGKPLKTPGRRDIIVPSTALAAAIAAEWDAQQHEVRPTTMPLTRLAATALDRVATERDKIARDVAAYAAADLVCYRADRPPALAARQHAAWQPLIDWAALHYDAPLRVTLGVIPTGQPQQSLNAFAAAVAAQDDFRLAALHALTAACGSLVIALALLEGRLHAAAAFAASQLDESFQIEAWGEDAEAADRRRALAAEIAIAARFLELLGES
jgi:chaperone required for assembly of F1-ATPase